MLFNSQNISVSSSWKSITSRLVLVSGAWKSVVRGYVLVGGVWKFLSYAHRFLITPASTNPDLYYDLSLAPAGFWSNVRSDGGDIRVTKHDGTTQLAREVSGFDYANKKGSLFIGMVPGSGCYIYYGNPSATEPAANAPYGKYAVWESAAKLVAHLEDTNDSTSNQNNGSTVLSLGTGKLAKGYVGDALHNISVPRNTSLEGMAGLTLMMWVNKGTTLIKPFGYWSGGTYHYILRELASGLQFYTYTTGLIGGYFNSASSAGWHLYVATYDGSTMRIYKDGGTPDATTFNQTGSIATGASNNLIMGAEYDQLNPMDGTIDEARIYSRALSPTEIATMYANQNDPASFWLTGGEE
jgi:hypothetical protein